jgi:chemotaxis protein methyltransferase CheR
MTTIAHRQSEIEALEVDLLLEAVYRRYGYDFRSYARASLERRLRQFLVGRNERRISELIPEVLRDEALFAKLALNFSIPVTEMFRDPPVYRALREQVVPLLRTYPFVKVWHAGCATGEEAYSLAIVLKEEDLYDRATIYATDFNAEAIEKARQGIYTVERMQEFTRNYQEAGGRRSLSEYYHARYNSAALDAGLRDRITFATHNLATDAAFGEMHLVMCRNVLIYFNRELQNRALRLFDESLVRGGFLCLGTKETLQFSEAADGYEIVDRAARIYRKKMS